ncbi:MAG: aspartyl protease family protein [Acidobacteriota bacterium]
MKRFSCRHFLVWAIGILTLGAAVGQPIEIPSRADGNQMRVPLRFGESETIWAVFDTGAPGPGVVITQPGLPDKMGWAHTGKAHIGGAGSGSGSQADVYRGVDLRMGELKLGDRRVIALPPDLDFVRETRKSGFEGVIGGAVLNRYVVEIDYARARLNLHDPEGFQPPQGSTVLPLSFNGSGHIFVDAQLRQQGGPPIPIRLVVDTGASHALSLETSRDQRITVPENALPRYLGRGINGEIHGRVGRIPELHLGDLVLRDLVASFPEPGHMPQLGKRNGNLGMGVLRRFVVFFDYAHQRMVLQPGPEFEKPFGFTTTGLRVSRWGDLFRVVSLIEDSPAAQQGIEKNDLLLAVDGRSMQSMTSDELKELLRQEDRTLRLRVRRGEEVREFELTTRRLL